MSWPSRILLVLLILASPGVAGARSRPLEFVKQIGVNWRPDKYAWMSFIAFSPDGSMIASDGAAGPDDDAGRLSFWTFPGGRLVRRFSGRPFGLSPDWKYYFTDQGVRDVRTDQPVRGLGAEGQAGYAFSPSTRYVAQASPKPSATDPRIRIVDLASGATVKAFGRLGAYAMAFRPDDRVLAVGHWDIVDLWNIGSGKRAAVLRGVGRYAEALAYDPSGRRLAVATDTGGLQVWDVRRRRKLASFDLEGGVVSVPAFSPDGRLLAAGVYGTGTVWLIDTARGKIIDHRQVSDLGCGSVAFSSDGRYLVTPSTGGLIRRPYDLGGTARVFRVRE